MSPAWFVVSLKELILSNHDHPHTADGGIDKITMADIIIQQREQTAEEFVKKHFPGLEKETWYPVIIAIAEGYAKQFKYDFSKSCDCSYSPGSTWCCNLCGLPKLERGGV